MRKAEQSAPWLWPYGANSAYGPTPDVEVGWVSRRLNQHARANVAPRFAYSNEALGALAYERRVALGEVPTRDLSHDWYNGMVWLAFPKVKLWINAQHLGDASAKTQALSASGNGRSRFRDALTLFDESGALLLTTRKDMLFSLMEHNWSGVFSQRDDSWHAQNRLLVFGHGLLDSMPGAHPGLCAKVLPVLVADLTSSTDTLEQMMLDVLKQVREPSNFSPLPVMGVPGWFDLSAQPGFYENRQVFRAKPTRQKGLRGERLAFQADGSTLAVGKCARQSLPALQGEESPDSSEQSAG